jgi:hypothetical protein
MKNKKYHTIGTVPNSKRKIVEREKKSTHPTHIYILLTFLD